MVLSCCYWRQEHLQIDLSPTSRRFFYEFHSQSLKAFHAHVRSIWAFCWRILPACLSRQEWKGKLGLPLCQGLLVELWDHDVSRNPNSSSVDSGRHFLGDCPVCRSGNISPDEKRSLWELKCNGAGHRQGGPWGTVTVLQSGSWPSLWCTGSLPGLGVYTPALQEHHVQDPHHMGTSHMDPIMWVHPRLLGHLSNQTPGGTGTGSLALSLSGELSWERVCRSLPRVRWWCSQAHMVAYLQAATLYFYLTGASVPEVKQISCDAW